MEDKKLLIVGIDPGTTIGYAVLDIDGNLIQIKSSKQLDLNLLISESIELGKVVLVGTDKLKVPGLVESFATKLGARVMNPKEDLKVDEKRKMTNNFSFGDEHQGDALAATLFAYKSAKPLLDKIDFFAKENKKYEIRDKIKELVITKRISIKSAVSIIEKKDEEAQIIEKVIIEKKLNENNFLKLYDKLKKYEEEIKLIKRYNNKLLKRIKDLEKNKLVEQKKDNKKLIDFRENRIKFLETLVKSKEKYIEQQGVLIKKFNNLISNINDFYILKKLGTFGINEFNFKNKILNIQRNDIVLVNDPNIISNDVIDILKDKVFLIIHKKPISKKIVEKIPFVFVNAKNLRIDEDKYFGFVEKKHFEMEKDKIDWAKKIIADYKQEKQLISR